MTVPLIAVRRWIAGETTADRRDADVPVDAVPDEEEKKRNAAESRIVLVWRGGKDAKPTKIPKNFARATQW
jgi:hypothetical protein